jgi:predicted kinase
VILIGASGTGKTTSFNARQGYVKTYEYLSLDKLRLALYVAPEERHLPAPEQYNKAYTRSKDDTTLFTRAQADFIKLIKARKNVVVDNTNLSNKRRRFFVTEAQKHGYRLEAVLTPISLKQLAANNENRQDKTVGWPVQRDQYMALQYPCYGDFNVVTVKPTYLPIS